MKNNKNSGLRIGIIFSIVSFLLTFTMFVPMFSVFPAELFGQAVSSAFGSLTHRLSGFITTLILAAIFALVLVLILKRVKKKARRNKKLKTQEIIVSMLIFYVVVHNLGYYIFLALNNFPIDALNTLLGIISFPFTSLLFIPFGFLMDWSWKKANRLNFV